MFWAFVEKSNAINQYYYRKQNKATFVLIVNNGIKLVLGVNKISNLNNCSAMIAQMVVENMPLNRYRYVCFGNCT